MIHNPNPNKYRIRKLRNKGYVLVAISILRRRKSLLKRNIKVLYPIDNKTKLGRPKASRRDVAKRNFFG